jgi:hypothetical protein
MINYSGKDHFFYENLIKPYKEIKDLAWNQSKLDTEILEKIEGTLFSIIVYASNFLPQWFTDNKECILSEIEEIAVAKHKFGMTLSPNLLDAKYNLIEKEKSTALKIKEGPLELANYQEKPDAIVKTQNIISNSISFFKAPVSSSTIIRNQNMLEDAKEKIHCANECISLLGERGKILSAMEDTINQIALTFDLSLRYLPEDITPLEEELLLSCEKYKFNQKLLTENTIQEVDALNDTEEKLLKSLNM